MDGDNRKKLQSHGGRGRPRKGRTAGVIAEAIASTGAHAELQRLLRSVRHWTSAGLLSLVAEKHPGGGFHRVYTRDALYEAALIYELTRYGLNTDDLAEPMFTLLGLRTDTAEGKGLKRWGQAITGKDEVWLWLVPPYDDRHTSFFLGIDNKRPRLSEGAVSLIEVNLTRLFKKVRE